MEYKIVEHIATLSETRTTVKEINLISYEGKASVLDIRNWDKETRRMYKGVTLTLSEADKAADAIKEWRERLG